jgi:hypothetical protein
MGRDVEMKIGGLMSRLALIGGATVLSLGVSATVASAGSSEHVRLSHGTNGQPNSTGAAKKVKEGDGGVGALLTSEDYGYGLISVNQSYSEALASIGTDRLVAVQVAVDGGWDQSPEVQQVLIQDLTVGINGTNTTFFPLPG